MGHRQKKRTPLALASVVTLAIGLIWLVFFSATRRRPGATSELSTKEPRITKPAPFGLASATSSPSGSANGPAAALESQLSDSEEAASYLNRGTELFQRGKFEEAATNYATAVKLTPGDETAHFDLALALARLGRPSEAQEQYLEALRLYPEYPEAHNNLGNLLASQGQLTEAVEHLNTALKLSPDSASAHNNLGTALVKQGKLNEAVVHFSEAARLMPGYAEARCNLGNAYLSQGRTDEAIAEFNAALHGNPDFEPALRGLAKARQKRAPTSLPPGTPTNPANASR